MTFAQLLANEAEARAEYDARWRNTRIRNDEPFRNWFIDKEMAAAVHCHYRTRTNNNLALSA